MTQWHEQSHYTVPLYAFMAQTKFGEKPGFYVYAVSSGGNYVYVGQTHGGVRLRLWRHVKQLNRFGCWIIDNEFAEPAPVCNIISIAGNLDAAERYYISAFGPELNEITYKSSYTLPPICRAPIAEINLERAGWHREYGAVTGRKKDAPIVVPGNPQPTLEDDFWERIARRAYRDPNHPDLRGRE